MSKGGDNTDQENQAETKDGCGKHCQALTKKYEIFYLLLRQ